jgi:hypothetical protein
MEVNTRNRAELRSYFVKNSIPTESNFAELIDGQLNQKDDGLVKLPGNPLSIEAAGDNTSPKKALNFYRNFSDPNPDWTLSLNPRSDPNNAASAKAGFTISDGEGNHRLFIDRATGNVGIGLTRPATPLAIRGNGGTSDVGITQKQVGGSATMELTTADGSGVQATRLLFRGNNDAADIEFYRGKRGAETLSLFIRGSDGSVGIGGAPTSGVKLDVFGLVQISDGTGFAVKNGYMASGSLTIGSTGLNYGGGQSWNSNTAGLLLETQANTEIAVHDSGTRLASLIHYQGDKTNRITIGRDMGWGAIGSILLNGSVGLGTTTPLYRLHVVASGGFGGETNEGLSQAGNVPIMAQSDSTAIGIINGSGRQAFALNINSNGGTTDKRGIPTFYDKYDGAWHPSISLKNGNVGVGLDNPQQKLAVDGYIAARQVYFSAYVDVNTRSGDLSPLPMQQTSQNIGNGYNTNTSKFTAPVKGVYLFTMVGHRVSSPVTNWLHWYLMVNDNYANPGGTTSDEAGERGLLSWEPNLYGVASRTIILALNSGDTVYIRQTGVGRCDNYRSGLEGVLLYATL